MFSDGLDGDAIDGFDRELRCDVNLVMANEDGLIRDGVAIHAWMHLNYYLVRPCYDFVHGSYVSVDDCLLSIGPSDSVVFIGFSSLFKISLDLVLARHFSFIAIFHDDVLF